MSPNLHQLLATNTLKKLNFHKKLGLHVPWFANQAKDLAIIKTITTIMMEPVRHGPWLAGRLTQLEF